MRDAKSISLISLNIEAGSLPFMVDGLFTTTPHYATEDTKLVCGLSDHCAIVSRLRRV